MPFPLPQAHVLEGRGHMGMWELLGRQGDRLDGPIPPAGWPWEQVSYPHQAQLLRSHFLHRGVVEIKQDMRLPRLRAEAP